MTLFGPLNVQAAGDDHTRYTTDSGATWATQHTGSWLTGCSISEASPGVRSYSLLGCRWALTAIPGDQYCTPATANTLDGTIVGSMLDSKTTVFSATVPGDFGDFNIQVDVHLLADNSSFSSGDTLEDRVDGGTLLTQSTVFNPVDMIAESGGVRFEVDELVEYALFDAGYSPGDYVAFVVDWRNDANEAILQDIEDNYSGWVTAELSYGGLSYETHFGFGGESALGFRAVYGPGGKAKKWDGSAWVEEAAQEWNGSSWEDSDIKVYNGSEFRNVRS